MEGARTHRPEDKPARNRERRRHAILVADSTVAELAEIVQTPTVRFTAGRDTAGPAPGLLRGRALPRLPFLDLANPMKLADRLARMIDGMPDGASITLPVDAVREWLSDNGSGLDPDLTVDEVATSFGRSPVTVRGWIRDGRLSAYRFRGREYRIPESAVEEFQQRERRTGEE